MKHQKLIRSNFYVIKAEEQLHQALITLLYYTFIYKLCEVVKSHYNIDCYNYRKISKYEVLLLFQCTEAQAALCES